MIKLLELVSSDKNFSVQRMEIVNKVSTVFNITQEEYKLIEAFVLSENICPLDLTDILIVSENIKNLIQLLFKAEIEEFKFLNGAIGIWDVTLSKAPANCLVSWGQ